MANAVFGARFATYVQDQIKARQTGLAGRAHASKSADTGEWETVDTLNTLETYNRQTCFTRLFSSINIDNDNGKTAQKYMLNGTQFASGDTVLRPNKEYDLDIFDPDLIQYTVGAAPDFQNPYLTSYGFLSDSTYGFVPPPGIVSVDIKALNRGSLREANINILCHSKDQFNIIDQLYLRLGYTMVLDWGWTQYELNNGLLEKFEDSRAYWVIPTVAFTDGATYDQILSGIETLRDETHGNYDCMIGRVVNYSWNLELDGSFNINLVLRSVGDVIESLKVNSSHPIKSDDRVIISTTENKQEEDTPPVEYNKERSSLNRILWYFSKISLYNEDSSVTTPAAISADTKLVSNINLPVESSKIDLLSLPFPSLEGVKKGSSKTKSQDYVRLGCLLRVIREYLLLYNDTTELLNINYERDDNFMLTYPRHGSLDPRVCLIPITTKVNPVPSPSGGGGGTPNKYDYIQETYTWNSIRVVPYEKDHTTKRESYHNGPWTKIPGKDGWPVLSNKTILSDADDVTAVSDGTLKITAGDERDSNDNIYEDILSALQNTSNLPTLISWNGPVGTFNDRGDGLFSEVKVDGISNPSGYSPQADILGKVTYTKYNATPWTGNDKIKYEKALTNYLDDIKNTIYEQTDVSKLWNGYYKKYVDWADEAFLEEEDIKDLLSKPIIVNNGLQPDSSTPKAVYTYKESYNGKNIFDLEVWEHNFTTYTLIDTGTNLTGATIAPSPDDEIPDVANGTYTDYVNPNSEFRTNEDFVGRTMEILVNINYLANTLESYVDVKTGDISLYDFLEKMMSGIQNALGNINSFNVTYDETTHQYKIVDSTFIPGLGNVKGDYFEPREVSKFSLGTRFNKYYHTTANIEGYSYGASFVRNFSIKTKLSNNFAAMTTIGAQANGNVVGENATALSKWNDGLIDRLNPVKANKNDPNKDEEIENSYKTNCGIVQALNDAVNDGNITNEQIDGAIGPGTDLFKYEIGKYVNDGKINPIGFLPIDLELTIDGLSGMKIYEIFDIDEQKLPELYNDQIQFIATGISHKIQNNDWTTTINSICGPKYDPFKQGAGNPPKRVKVKYGQNTGVDTYGGDVNAGAPPKGDGDVAFIRQAKGPQIEEYWNTIIHHGTNENTKIYSVNGGNTKWRVNHRWSSILNGYIPADHPKKAEIIQKNNNRDYGVWDFVLSNYVKDSSGNLTKGTTTDVPMPAPFDGFVRVGPNSGGTGNFAAIYADDGRTAVFFHFRTLLIDDKQRVTKGTPLGVQGNTGESRGVHTHIEGMTANDYAEYVNYLLSQRPQNPPA